MGSGWAGFLKGHFITHYADAGPLNPTLPSYMLILPSCPMLDKDSWVFILRLPNSDYLFGKGYHEKRVWEYGGVWQDCNLEAPPK